MLRPQAGPEGVAHVLEGGLEVHRAARPLEAGGHHGAPVGARLGEVVSGLTGWDHLQVDLDQTGYYDDPYGTIFNAWWFALADGVFDEVSGISNRFVVGNLVDRMLAGADAGRPLQYGYLEGATPAEAVTGALIAALDGLTADYGSADMSAWMQPISVINWAPLPLSPGLSPGQSGDPASPHFSDQQALYATWTYKPMRLSKADLKGYIESTIVLNLSRAAWRELVCRRSLHSCDPACGGRTCATWGCSPSNRSRAGCRAQRIRSAGSG